MRWRDLRRSENVEDRRSMSLGGAGLKLGGGTLLLVRLVSRFHARHLRPAGPVVPDWA